MSLSLLSLMLAVSAALGPPAAVSQPQVPAQPQVATPAAPATLSPASASLADLVSIAHIREEIERQPTLTFRMPDPNTPRFQIQIQGFRFDLKPIQDFTVTKYPVPMPFGGVDHYEMMRLITPPEFWGSAPFTNGDLLKMSALTGAYGLAGALVKKGIEASSNARRNRAHEEVEQELEQIASHNAKVAAGLTDDGTKQDDAKKKAAAEKEKKKKDGNGGMDVGSW